MNAAQLLLRQQFPQLPGLQDVSLGQTMAFNVIPGEFVQILHTSHDHWLTISTIRVKHPTVKIYDSLFDCLPQLAKAQIASLLCSKHNVIEAHIMDVKLQVRNNLLLIAIQKRSLLPYTFSPISVRYI